MIIIFIQLIDYEILGDQLYGMVIGPKIVHYGQQNWLID